MIYEHKIKSLTEEELGLLMYILTEYSSCKTEWNYEYLKALKPNTLFILLNESAAKAKKENIPIIQSISDKLINN